MIDSRTKSHWLEYQPCYITSWCEETGGFDCAQAERTFIPANPHFGTNMRYVIDDYLDAMLDLTD